MILAWYQLILIISVSLLIGAFYTVYLLRQTIGKDAFNVIFEEMGEQSMKNVSFVLGGLIQLDKKLGEEPEEENEDA